MSYKFYNNWPYYNTVFPTMEDHVDPPNHEYFSGLMTEISNIEKYLGTHPQGSYDTVGDRFLGTAHKNVSILKGAAEKTPITNEQWIIDRSVFGTILPWGWISEYFNVYIQLSTWLKNTSGGYSCGCKIAWEDSNENFEDIVEVSYIGTTLDVKQSAWVNLSDIVDTEDEWIYIAGGYICNGGTGTINKATVSLRFEIK